MTDGRKNLDRIYVNTLVYVIEILRFALNDNLCQLIYCFLEKNRKRQVYQLVLFTSFWLNKKYGFFRFCSTRKIGPSLESDYVKNTPHFYVIGVGIKKKVK